MEGQDPVHPTQLIVLLPNRRLTRKTAPTGCYWKIIERGPPTIPRTPTCTWREVEKELAVLDISYQHAVLTRACHELYRERDSRVRKLTKYQERVWRSDRAIAHMEQRINALTTEARGHNPEVTCTVQ